MRSGAERGQRGGDAEGCEVAVGVVHTKGQEEKRIWDMRGT